MTPQQPSYEQRWSKLAVLGLVLAVVGLCFAPLALVGVVLAFIGRAQAKRDESLKGGHFAVATVPLFGVSLCLTFSMLATLPNFLSDMNRMKQSECRSALKAIYTAAAFDFAETHQYALDEAEKAAPRTGRYSYLLGLNADGAPRVVAGRDGADPTLVAKALALVPVGLKGECPACSVTFACVANLDGDDEPDVWSVSSADRWTTYGDHLPPGWIHNDRRDSLDDAPNPLTFDRPAGAVLPLLDGGTSRDPNDQPDDLVPP